MPGRALPRGAVTVVAALAASGCQAPSSDEGRASSGRSGDAPPASSAAALSAFDTSGAVPLHAQLRPRPDAGPLDAKTIAEHWRSAARLRLWWTEAPLESKGEPRPPRKLRFTVLAESDRAALVASIGTQKPAVVDDCAPCPELLNVVAEDALGLQLGTLELGCHASAVLRFHGAASDVCGTLDARELPALLSLALRAQKGAPGAEGARLSPSPAAPSVALP